MTPDQLTILATARAHPDMTANGNADVAELRAAAGLSDSAFAMAIIDMIHQGWLTKYSVLTGQRLALTWAGRDVALAQGTNNG